MAAGGPSLGDETSVGVKMSVDAEVNAQDAREQVLRLIDYLAEYDAQRNKPVRDISDYRLFRLAQGALPDHQAVQLRPNETDWLGIGFVDLPPAPEVPDGVRNHLAEGAQLSATKRPSVNVPRPAYEEADELDEADRPQFSDEERQEQLQKFEEYVAQVQAWILDHWEPWSKDHAIASRVKSVHRDLFEQRERLLLDRESVEFVWGFGRARWSVDGYIIDHPLITVPAEISLDQKTQRLSVVPAAAPEVEIRYLAGLDIHDRPSITSARQTATEVELHPWNSEEMAGLLLRLTRSIDDNGIVVAEAGSPTASLVVDQSWTLYMRQRVPDSQGFLDQMREIYLTDGTIPQPLRDVVSHAGEIETHGSGQPGTGPSSPSQPLLLPLATNEEQERILELAQKHPGVTVQGPPGTGKSHTIANLISHYAAYGQRVLVVAEKEQALKVLSDKIPAGIRDLTVSVLGADEDSRKSLEKSVTTIQSKVGTLDTSAADEAIERLRLDLDTANRGIAETTTEMLRARQAEVEAAPGIWLAGGEPTPQTAAAWVRDNAATLGYIRDVLELSASLPISPPKYTEYLGLLDSVGLQQTQQALTKLPTTGDIPTAAEVAAIFTAISEGNRRASSVKSTFADWALFISSSLPDIRGVRSAVSQYAESLNELETSPYASLLPHLSDQLLTQELAGYHHALSSSREEAIRHRGALMASVVELVASATQESLLRIVDAQKHLASSGKLGLFDRQHKKTLASFTVNGRIPQSPDEAGQCIAATLLDLVRQHISRIFLNQSPLARETTLSARPEDDVAHEVQSLQKLLNLPGQQHQLSAQLQRLGVRSSDLGRAEDSQRLVHDIDEAFQYFQAAESRSKIDELESAVKEGGHQADASPLWFQLLDALQHQDSEQWGQLRGEVIRFNALAEPALRLKLLRNELFAAAPKWAEILETDPATAPDAETINGAWQWRQLDCWVSGRTKQASPAELQSRIDELGVRRRRTVAELVEVLAWRRLADNLGPKERQALQGYLKAVTRYGKTGGKYAQRWIREMREALNDAKDAVPVWIMTTSRALTSFRPSSVPPFDVLIVDEASQIGFEALPLLSLAKKAIVVGDDKQTSPEHVGLDRQKVFDIMDDHLAEVPKYRTLFDPDNSLYDLATQKFAAPVMLSEHFRCLPEIIAFSNQHAYNRNIVPLRDQAPRPGWIPLGVLRVKDGYREGDINEQEAKQVAHLIAEMCEDEAYDGMTFGVVTLLGSSQAKLIWDKLFDRLGPEQLEERRIRCGEAANFQGDERDVIVISTVVAPDPNQSSTRFGAMSGVKDLRKINVAASRARNQMWVVTSVDPEMLPNGDFRAALIRHCSSYVADAPDQDKILADCESEFERRVVNQLLNRGYKGVAVQKVVGRYRLDIVVSGPERRLAIECDGDRWHGPDVWYQDRARQEVLERAGWTFERIRGSAFFRDPDAAMKPVWEHLDSLGIITGDEWLEGPKTSLVREVTMDDLPGEPAVIQSSGAALSPVEGVESDLDWDAFLESLDESTKGVTEQGSATGLESETVRETVPAPDVPAQMTKQEFPPVSPAVEAEDVVTEDPEDGEDDAEGVDDESSAGDYCQDVAPSTAYVTLAPYEQWALAPKPSVTESNIAFIQQGIVEIVRSEGPMLARQAYLRYQQATGGSRVGKKLQRIFNKAVSRAVRSGMVARIDDGVTGLVGVTLYIPGSDPVRVRRLGTRTIFEVPQSELQALFELLDAKGVQEDELDREVLNALGLKRLTERTISFLQECRSYTWRVP